MHYTKISLIYSEITDILCIFIVSNKKYIKFACFYCAYSEICVFAGKTDEIS